ncbi:MAG: class I SAM-dependent methyltransferase [Candidatus Eisenbacteria bacterium]
MKGEQERAISPWFVDAFQDRYLALYAHRDSREAERLTSTLDRAGHLRGQVLDLCCGGGRLLAALPAGAIGLDLSLPLLRAARVTDAKQSLVRADMRRLPLGAQRFDLAISFFTSFGYFDSPEDDGAVLTEVRRVLRPEGRLVLDFLNADELRRTLEPETSRRVGDLEVRESRWIDESGPFVRKRVTIGADVWEERVRLYTASELHRQLEAHGLRVVETWGDYEGCPFDPAQSPRVISIAIKEGA